MKEGVLSVWGVGNWGFSSSLVGLYVYFHVFLWVWFWSLLGFTYRLVLVGVLLLGLFCHRDVYYVLIGYQAIVDPYQL